MASRFARFTPFLNPLRTSPLLHRIRSNPTARFAGRHTGNFIYAVMLIAPPLIFFNSNVGMYMIVNGPSMYPTFNESVDRDMKRDVAWVNKWRPVEGLRRGCIVTLISPLHPEVISVKRVIALEGDTVFTRDPHPYAYAVVPEGHVWVEGDGCHSGKPTLDSNTYGPISMNLITGRVTYQLFPLEKAGKINWWEWRPKTKVIRARKMQELIWT